MTSDKLKYIVSQIKKKAQGAGGGGDYAPPPAGSYQGDTGGPATTPPAHTGYYGGNPAITKMQRALQELSKDVTAQINLQDVSSGDPEKEKRAKERDAFGVFLTKNYMRNTKVPGVEFNPDPKATDQSQKSPNDPTRMSVVMDTMYRVGNPKRGEGLVDGVWDFRTNAAVRDAFAFASGLFSFVDDINRFATRKMQIQSYNKESLQNLATMATPDNSLTPAQKNEAAPLVTLHVKAIQAMYEEVKNHILQHPAYQQFIEGDVPFKQYYKVSPQQISLLQKRFPQGIDVTFPNFKSNIKIEDLTSLDAVKTWMQRAAPDAVKDGSLTPEAVVSAVWEAQKQILGSDQGF